MGVRDFVLRLFPEGDWKDIVRAYAVYNRKSTYVRYHAAFRSGAFRLGARISFPGVEPVDILLPWDTEIWHFGFEKDMAGYLQRGVPRKGTNVIHGGAYPGHLIVYLAKLLGPESKVFALEPNPTAIPYLESIIELNGVKNVEIVPRAIHSEEKSLEFSVNHLASGFADLQDSSQSTKTHIVQVEATTLDAFIAEHGLSEKPLWVYLDIEGAEIEALEGARQALANGKTSFAIASYHIRQGESTMTHVQIEKAFAGSGFNVHTIYPDHLTTYIIPKQLGDEQGS